MTNLKTKENIKNIIKSDLYLTFCLGNDFYGISVESAKEVMNYSNVFKTPGVPDYIKGVINLRGEVVPIIDLSVRFYNKKSEVIDSTGIIIVEIKDKNIFIPIGVMIDSIESVVNIYEDKIESSPEIGAKIRPDFISGIGKTENKFVILLDVDTVLNIDEISNLKLKRLKKIK
jgi:purine-binding chemotaxis protein CheW